MILSSQEARDVVWGDHDDWDTVAGTVHIVDRSRWSVQYEGVFLHKPSGKHYQFYWSRGATEQQDEQPFECDDNVTPQEVEEREVVRKEWVAV